MMSILAHLLLFSVISAPFPTLDSSYDNLWKAYKVKYKESVAADEEDRRLIWERNARLISKHNLEADFGFHTYKLELNRFADKTAAELDVYRKCYRPPTFPKTKVNITTKGCGKACYNLPDSVDWRKEGFVTEVKDQGDCGSCWAFSSTGALEGQTKSKLGYLVSLSEQNLVDCSWEQGNNGCSGGWMDYAFQYVIENQGIDTEKYYPYKGRDSHCKFKLSGVGANCTSYAFVESGDETSLKAVVATVGPVSVAIDASSDAFMFYKSGIYNDFHCSSTQLDHAVLVVGYGTQNGIDYWIVKNSWGKSWGMDGYILMARNMNNMCGIATHAVYPIV